MNPKRFFVDEPKVTKSNSLDKYLGIYFKLDINPGYYKDGYFYDVKSTFTGWTEERENDDIEPYEEEKIVMKIPKEDSLFGKETKIRNIIIKKILYMPNYRLEDTKNYFLQKENEENNVGEDILNFKDIPDFTESDENFNINDDFSINNNNEENQDFIVNSFASKPIEKICNEIKLTEEQKKQYETKLKLAKESKMNIFELIEEFRKKKISEKSNLNKIDNISTTEEISTSPKLIKNIESNEIQLLTPYEQHEKLMFFIPDDTNKDSNAICESCKEKGHTKKECILYPDPDFDKALKFCVNCGNSGHLYCRKGLNDDENLGDYRPEGEDEENLDLNEGLKYYFDFDIRDEDMKEKSEIHEDEEELYENGVINIINEDEKENNMLNTLKK